MTITKDQVTSVSPHTDESGGDPDDVVSEDGDGAREDAKVKVMRSPGSPTREEMAVSYTHLTLPTKRIV